MSEQQRSTFITETEASNLFASHVSRLREQGEEERANELWDKFQDHQISMPDAICMSEQGVSVGFGGIRKTAHLKGRINI